MQNSSNTSILTEKELRYIECDTPMSSLFVTVMKITIGVIISLVGLLLTAASSSSPAADKFLKNTLKSAKYTKYKKAVIRKQNSASKKSDAKLLRKINSTDFVFSQTETTNDSFDEELIRIYSQHPQFRKNNKDEQE